MLHGHYNRIKYDTESYGLLKYLGIDNVIEESLARMRGLLVLNPQLFILANLLYFNPWPLLISYKHITKLLFFFDGLEVINNHAYEEVVDELTSNDHKSNEINYGWDGTLVNNWLHVSPNIINTIVHYIDQTPRLSSSGKEFRMHLSCRQN